MKDFKNKMLQKIILRSQTIATDKTTVGAVIDRYSYPEYNSLTYIIASGAVTAGDATLLIEDSSDGVTYTAVADKYLVGLEANTKVDAADKSARIGYIGNNRYVRASVVTANSANLAVGVIAILADSEAEPTPEV